MCTQPLSLTHGAASPSVTQVTPSAGRSELMKGVGGPSSTKFYEAWTHFVKALRRAEIGREEPRLAEMGRDWPRSREEPRGHRHANLAGSRRISPDLAESRRISLHRRRAPTPALSHTSPKRSRSRSRSTRCTWPLPRQKIPSATPFRRCDLERTIVRVRILRAPLRILGAGSPRPRSQCGE